MSRFLVFSVALLVVGVLVAVVGGSIVSYVSFSNTGVVKTVGVGVYWDVTCANVVSSIGWGAVEPGSTKNFTVYVRNEGTSSATLSLSTGNWSPSSASNYIFLSWDYGGQVLSPSQVVQVMLILSISSSIAGISNFSFDITISASS